MRGLFLVAIEEVSRQHQQADYSAIADYAVIGDMQTCALVSLAGSVDWLCFPNLADEALFARVLDRLAGGHFRISPAGSATASRRYLYGGNVLRTRFATPEGVFTVTDFLALRTEGIGGTLEPEREMLRILEVLEGEAQVAFSFEPRPGYGGEPHLRRRGRTAWACQHSADLVLFRTDMAVAGSDDRSITGVERLSQGEKRYFSLSFCRRDIGIVPALGEECERKLHAATDWWRGWIGDSAYRGEYQDAVERSLAALRLLASRETGAVAAAATTSLPEWIGGERNWDYRYCWMRDAYFVLSTFIRCGFRKEAQAYFDWLMHATQLDKPTLKPVYDIFGRSDLHERAIPQLEGYCRSAPVRIGNGAGKQLQLDCYGSVILAACELVREGATIGHSEAKRLRGFVETVCRCWDQPDNGIWEMREQRLHHVYSKAMCWAALNGALWLQERGQLSLEREAIETLRDEIRTTILTRGWNQKLQAFTGAFGCNHLDASVLLLPKLGLIDPGDPRMRSTFDRIDAELSQGPFVWRYDPKVDSSTDSEGSFIACGFWAAEYLASIGRFAEARERIHAFLEAANDVCLFSEQFDPSSRTMLGNVPQGLSHAALLHAALALQPDRQAEGFAE